MRRSPFLERVLLVLYAISPASCSDVAKSLRRPQPSAYWALVELQKRNLVVRTGFATYEVTRRGERVVKERLYADVGLFG